MVDGRWIQVLLDASAWAIGLTFATLARYDFNLSQVDVTGLLLMIPLAGLAQWVGGLIWGVYLGRWRYGSFDEAAGVFKATGTATLITFWLDFFVSRHHMVPLSATVAGGITAMVLMMSVRYLARLAMDRDRKPTSAEAIRTIVFGAGEGGVQVLTAMLRDRQSPYVPVALVDDDPRKRNLRLFGVPVVGDSRRLVAVSERLGAQAVLVAIPSAGRDTIRRITDLAMDGGLDVKVLPPVKELFGSKVGVGDIRDLTPEDLLGRHEIRTDVGSIANYLTGRRVLVTGAGGSIGSELARQIWTFAPAELILLDRDESALHAVELSIRGRALLESAGLVLVDIRDKERLETVMAEHRPHVVFHAAALKHVTLLERFPEEAIKTNILGSLSVLEAAAKVGTERFVNISTDKAADPISVLGYSKRIAERLTACMSRRAEGTYLSVRFGNVLGSRGSMLTTFTAQIEAGGPITVTDPDVTRFFMTVQEAVELVIQAGAIGRGGETLVLDMGNPVRISDVARRLCAQADRPIRMEFTGLRPGEKLEEVLFGEGEVDHRPVHHLISHVHVEPLDPEEVRHVPTSASGDELIARMVELAYLHERSSRRG